MLGTMNRLHKFYQPWHPPWMQEGLHQQQRELRRHLQEQQAHQLRAEEAALQASRMLLPPCTPVEGPVVVMACELCLLMVTFKLVRSDSSSLWKTADAHLHVLPCKLLP